MYRCLLLLLLLPLGVARAETRDLLGDNGILFWTPEQQLAGYPNIDQLYPTRAIAASELPFPLVDDGGVLANLSYRFDGKRGNVDAFLRDTNAAGLIVLRGSRVLLEEYRLGHGPDRRWISFSVAKSVTALLFGAAIADGYIGSVDDAVVDYIPGLRGGPYQAVTIRHVLQMTSGVAWNEDYTDPESDIAQLPRGKVALMAYLNGKERVAAPGERFNYNTAETDLAGAVLRAAIGNNLSTYLQRKIWQPFGMASDASWLLYGEQDAEYGGCCINATLRDWARIGLFILRDGRLLDGTQVLPAGWIADATTPAAAYEGYGYYLWLPGNGVIEAEGVFGQFIWVDPARELVIAMHSAWPEAWNDRYEAHVRAFFAAVADAAGDP